MFQRTVCGFLGMIVAVTSMGWIEPAHSETGSVKAAVAFLESLSDDQRAQAALPFDSPQRTDWHFFPRERDGVPIGLLDESQKEKLTALLSTVLSDVGVDQVMGVVKCEVVLKAKEGTPSRDPARFHTVVWGTPAPDAPWGWRFEGHHLSLNVVLEGDKIQGVTPVFLGANPAKVLDGEFAGFRNLPLEEDLAFEFLASLTKEQKLKAKVSEDPVEVEGAGKVSIEPSLGAGLAAAELSQPQKKELADLIGAYLDCFNDSARIAGSAESLAADPTLVFQWRGGMTQGEPCSYRISSKTLDIQFINQQNNANHIHTVMWFPGKDFGG